MVLSVDMREYDAVVEVERRDEYVRGECTNLRGWVAVCVRKRKEGFYYVRNVIMPERLCPSMRDPK